MEEKSKLPAEWADMDNLPELLSEFLKGRVGFCLGDFPQYEKYPLVTVPGSNSVNFTNEKLIDRLSRLDFVLLDAECAYLSELPYLLENLGKKLVNHGLILLYDNSVGAKRHTLWHKILSSGEVEFLSESSFHQGTLYLFQWVKPREQTVVSIKPLRYRIADKVSQMLSSMPGLKRVLKNLARPLR